MQCPVPGADVFVDEGRVGKTPLETTVTLAPGPHHVEVRRGGYVPATRDVTLQDGARAELSLDPAIDKSALGHDGGWLAIDASEAQAIVTIDERERGLLAGPILLPAGPHRLRVESGGFVPADRDVDVPPGASTAVTIVLEPTPETQSRYVASATTRRTWSWVTIGVGAALAAGGVSFALAEQGQLQGARSDLAAANAAWVRGSGRSCDFSQELPPTQQASCETLLNGANARVDATEARRAIGWVVAGVGGAATVVGIAVLLTSDNPHRYDEPPAARTFAGWRVVPHLGVGGGSLSAVRTF